MLEHPTPFYFYDLELLRQRVRRAKKAMPATLYFAVKANPNEHVLRALLGEVDGLDVASVGEIELAMRCGWSPSQLSFAGPAKTNAALDFAVRAGVLINVESPRELEYLASLDMRPNVRVRVNPRLQLRSWRVSMSGVPSPFGVDEEEFSSLTPLLRRVNFEGIHVNPGGQCTSVGGFTAAITATLDIAAHCELPVRSINFGGGWGVVDDTELDVEAAGAKFTTMLERFRATTGRDVNAIVEPGRWLAAPCGTYVARVISQKVSRGTHFVMLDGGMHQHLGATGHLGGAPMRVVNLSRTDGPRVKRTIVGPLCTPLDTFGEVELVEPQLGDLLGVPNSGAYGPTFSPTRFLGHDAPVEYVR